MGVGCTVESVVEGRIGRHLLVCLFQTIQDVKGNEGMVYLRILYSAV